MWSTFALTKDKWESIFGTCFYAFKLFYYRIEPNNSNELQAEPVLFLMNELKIEASLSRTQIALEKVLTILLVFLETLENF